ncbi:uncharacterized protein LOC126675288 [Mercurialis annua]|uniref:uncharacterized protein LOC126675288 n=1 Tax=Mercurialis annua TaxID=3986 RepID=UPI00215E8AF3|nr:uncharacterized protein LOC126675288 [Mercurialis annua]
MGKITGSSKQHFQENLGKSIKPIKNKKKPIKITYISNPTLFRATNASDFRAIVQELTGKDSKVLDFACDDHSNETSQGPSIETPSLKIESDITDDVFSSYTSSSSLESVEDSFFWKNVSEGFFDFNNTNHVFV